MPILVYTHREHDAENKYYQIPTLSDGHDIFLIDSYLRYYALPGRRRDL